MDKTVYDFKKTRDGKYAFIMKNDLIERTEVVDEKYVKEHYKELTNQKREYMENLGKINRDLEKFKVEKDPELEHFIELANKAANYAKYMNAQRDQESLLKLIDNTEEGIKHIEAVFPELKRAKK